MPPPDPSEPDVDGGIMSTSSVSWTYPSVGVTVTVAMHRWDHPDVTRVTQVARKPLGGEARDPDRPDVDADEE